MTSRISLLKKTLLFLLAFQLAGLTPLLSLSKAHALYWEDDFDGNDPKDRKKRPDDFFLFRWIDDLNQDAKKNEYKDRDNRDKGPGVNGDARTLLILTSGLVGLGAGMLIANRVSAQGDVSGNMFIGGALGLVAGVGIGALIMPHNYEIDPHAMSDLLKERQARSEDPVQKKIAMSFHQPQVALQLQF